MPERYCLSFMSIVLSKAIFVKRACLESCMVNMKNNST